MAKQQQQQQQLPFHGIFKESFSLILSSKTLFTHITLLTIFPLSLLFLIHLHISEHFFSRIASFDNPNSVLPSEQIAFKIAYLALFLASSLASTSAVVLAAACVYTKREVRFAELIMSVSPEVWRRLIVTFAWSLIVVVAYNMAAFSVVLPCFWCSSDDLSPARVSNSGPLFVIYFLGFVCMSIIWHLGSVVSVLEEECGFEAMMKGVALVRGRMVISGGVFLVLNLGFVVVQEVFVRFVVGGEVVWSRVIWGILCLFLLSLFTLLGLVVQTVVYFVCKLDGDGIVDIEELLANQVGVYLGDYYAPLRSSNVKLDQCSC